MKPKYVATCEATKEAVWLQKFLMDLSVVFVASRSVSLYYDNSRPIANSKEPRSYKKKKRMNWEEVSSHLNIIEWGKATVNKIVLKENLANLFTKALPPKSFEGPLVGFRMQKM